MNYAESLSYLTRLGNEVLTMKFGLETIRRLVEEMDNVHRAFDSVLVAGTNGKGSVARQLAAITTAAGIRTGLYTSPHLIRITERVSIGQEEISPDEFAQSLTDVVEAIARIHPTVHPTFFETVTAAALAYFARRQVALAVLEIGMGGRLDSCNIVDPLVSIITPIGLDHQQYLGETLTAIAGEKAGILRAGTPAWSAQQDAEAAAALEAVAHSRDSRLSYVRADDFRVIAEERGYYRFEMDGESYDLGSPGLCQAANGALAIRAAEELRDRGFPIELRHLHSGLARARIPGVLHQIGSDPLILIDGGHNPQAADNLAEYVRKHLVKPRALVFGIMADKDAGRVLNALLPHFEEVIFTQVDSPRAASPIQLRDRFLPQAEVISNRLEALNRARRSAASVVVAGSFYLAGQLLAELETE